MTKFANFLEIRMMMNKTEKKTEMKVKIL